MKRGRPTKPDKKKANYSLEIKTVERINELAERLGVDKGEVIDKAIENYTKAADAAKAFDKLEAIINILSDDMKI